MMNALGDGTNGCRWITDLVSKNGITHYFLTRRNVTFRSKGFAGCSDMLDSIWEDMQEWLKQYHIPSISETVNSMVEARFGSPLRKRLDARKVTETRLKNVAHNVRRMGYLEIIDGIIPHWPRKAV
jgi:transposase